MTHISLINKFKILFLFVLVAVFSGSSFGQFSSEILQMNTIQKSQKVKTIPKLKIGAQAGYGYRFASIPYTTNSIMNRHLKKLKNNLSFGADFSYFFTNNIGVGIKYNAIVSHALTDSIFYSFADGVKYYNYLSELSNTHLFAPIIATQFFIVPKKHCLFANVGVGYVRYHNKAILFIASTQSNPIKDIVTIPKNSAAFFAEIGYDFFVHKSFAIGLQVSTLIELRKGKLIEPNNLSHIDISLGFRFYNM